MGLNIQKLKKVRRLAGGIVQAQCPACAEGGQDRQGEHLRVYPDGKYGCCVHPKDREHRKRVFALAGCKEGLLSPGSITVRVKEAAVPAVKVPPGDVLGRLGRVFGGPVEPAASPAPPVGTLGTPQYIYTCEEKLESAYIYRGFGRPVPSVPEKTGQSVLEFETSVPSVPTVPVVKESQTGVPSVPKPVDAAAAPPVSEELPYLTAGGDLVIPFDSPERYHYWRGGQSVAETKREVLARLGIKKG
jgi:hypothetical protein